MNPSHRQSFSNNSQQQSRDFGYLPRTSSGLSGPRMRFGQQAPIPNPRPRSSASRPNPEPRYYNAPVYYDNYNNSTAAQPEVDNAANYDEEYVDTPDMDSEGQGQSDSWNAPEGVGGQTAPWSSTDNFDQRNSNLMEGDSTSQQTHYVAASLMGSSNQASSSNRANRISGSRSAPPPIGSAKHYFIQLMKERKRKAPPEQLRCELCNLDFTSKIPLYMHLDGAKHNRKIAMQKIQQTLKSEKSLQAAMTEDKPLYCKICDLTLTSVITLQMHFNGAKHKKKAKLAGVTTDGDEATGVETTSGDESTSGAERGIKVESDESPAKMSKYFCDCCSVTSNSLVQHQMHLSSVRHKTKMKFVDFRQASDLLAPPTTTPNDPSDQNPSEQENP